MLQGKSHRNPAVSVGTAELEHCVAGYMVSAHIVGAGAVLSVEAFAELAFESPQEHNNTLTSEVIHTTVVENAFVLHLLIEGAEEDSSRDKKCPVVAVVAAVVVAAAAAAVEVDAVAIESHDAPVAGNEYIVAYRDRRRAAGS